MKAAWVLLLLVALSAPGFAQTPDDNLIMPGQRIGKWALDMTIDDLLRMNGPRKSVFEGVPALQQVTGKEMAADVWVHLWHHLGLLAWTIGRDSQSVVELGLNWEAWVTTRDGPVAVRPGHKTDKGVGIGFSKEAVESAYGPPTAVVYYAAHPYVWWPVYDQIGLTVRISVGAVPILGAYYVGIF